MLGVLLFTSLACAHKQVSTMVAPAPEASRVLVVVNANSKVSEELGRFYMRTRVIPTQNLLEVKTGTEDDITFDDYKSKILDPIRGRLPWPKLKYIVLVKGIPLRISDKGRYSVDGHVAVANLDRGELNKADETDAPLQNPYFGKNEPFDPAKFGFFLVCRLDGYDASDVRRLILNSALAKPQKGPFFFDAKRTSAGGGYGEMDSSLVQASKVLKARGFDATTETTPEFVAPKDPLMGYASWGSNDERFDADTYHHISFKPGALAETFVSTSARTFSPVHEGQSMIADLIQQGVTGVKGYVSEPYTRALAKPDILFDRYTSGYTLAESFYMASPMIKWKDVVVGDPLCCPYRK